MDDEKAKMLAMMYVAVLVCIVIACTVNRPQPAFAEHKHQVAVNATVNLVVHHVHHQVQQPEPERRRIGF